MILLLLLIPWSSSVKYLLSSRKINSPSGLKGLSQGKLIVTSKDMKVSSPLYNRKPTGHLKKAGKQACRPVQAELVVLVKIYHVRECTAVRREIVGM
jgi:hypothetical protein